MQAVESLVFPINALKLSASQLLPSQAKTPVYSVITTLTIQNELGLHARPAALFVKTASRFSSEITVSNGQELVSGKSLLGILMLGASQGTRIQVAAEGEDSHEAILALAHLVNNELGEKD